MATRCFAHKPLALLVLLAAVSTACGDDSDSGTDVPGATDDDSVALETSVTTDDQEDDTAATDHTLATGDPECEHDRYEDDQVLGALDADGRFDLVICLVETYEGLVDVYSRPAWNHTLLAPTDEALVADLGEEIVAALVAGESVQIGEQESVMTPAAPLEHHTLGDDLPPDEFVTGAYTNLDRAEVRVVADGTTINVGDATVLDQLNASNGIVYAVDGVVGLPE